MTTLGLIIWTGLLLLSHFLLINAIVAWRRRNDPLWTYRRLLRGLHGAQRARLEEALQQRQQLTFPAGGHPSGQSATLTDAPAHPAGGTICGATALHAPGRCSRPTGHEGYHHDHQTQHSWKP